MLPQLVSTHVERPTLRQTFSPVNTGSPRQDVYNHVSRLPQLARLDFEEHIIAGNLIVRIEPDLGSSAEPEKETKIVSVPYAERIFGNLADAVEFVRCVKLIAGEDGRARELQTVASYYYKEAKARLAGDVLKEMGLLALHLSSVTAMEEDRGFGEVSETEIESVASTFSDSDTVSLSDKRAESMRCAAEVLGETEITHADIFQLELRAAARHLSHKTGGFSYDEFAAHLAEMDAATESAEEADALFLNYEAVYEQYDEDHVVSLHMSDGERVVVVGTLDDDVDENSLPEEAKHLASEQRRLYLIGMSLEEINELMEAEIDFLYQERVERTMRLLVSIKGATIEVPRTVKLLRYAEEREQTRFVLEKLLEQLSADFHSRACHASQLYRAFHRRIRRAQNAGEVAAAIKEAYQAKEDGRLTLAQFTALNTAAKSQYLKCEPPALPAPLRQRFVNQLLREIETASARKLTFLRWAMYGQNCPDHTIHKLPRQDRARLWETLKARSNVASQMMLPAA
jgi:hypothetical protein